MMDINYCDNGRCDMLVLDKLRWPMKILITLPWMLSCSDAYVLKLNLVVKLWML